MSCSIIKKTAESRERKSEKNKQKIVLENWAEMLGYARVERANAGTESVMSSEWFQSGFR